MLTKTWLSGLLILTCGCSSMNNTEKGVGGGALVGAGAGALLGRGNPAAIAAGALLGGATGGIVGANQDDREARRNAANAQYIAAANAQAARQMSLDEIVQLAQRGTRDDIIIQQIATTGSVFSLTSADITYLQDQRVSSQVISYMQTRRYVVVQPRPVVVYERPYYPPPVGFGVVIGR